MTTDGIIPSKIANLLALDKLALLSGKIDTMLETLRKQPDDFQITWTFGGTLHFISPPDTLSPLAAAVLWRAHSHGPPSHDHGLTRSVGELSYWDKVSTWSG
jgi:hypothetical protein